MEQKQPKAEGKKKASPAPEDLRFVAFGAESSVGWVDQRTNPTQITIGPAQIVRSPIKIISPEDTSIP